MKSERSWVREVIDDEGGIWLGHWKRSLIKLVHIPASCSCPQKGPKEGGQRGMELGRERGRDVPNTGEM